MQSLRDLLKRLAVLGAALAVSIAIGAVLIALVGVDVSKAMKALLLGPWTAYGIPEILVRATPLLLVGLGIIVSFRTGVLNIGGEGQMLVGGIAGAAMALSLPMLSSWLAIPLMLVIGTMAGALWGGLAGWLRAKFEVSELLSTIMLNNIAIQIMTYVVRGPLADPSEVSSMGYGYNQTAVLPKNAWLPRLVPRSRLHWGFVLALFLAVFVLIFLWRTVFGYRFRAVGASAEASKYAGINVQRYFVASMAIAGGFAGLAGIVEVSGLVHRAGTQGYSAGYGFTGIVAALFGQLHPIGLIVSSILFGALLVGADMMQQAVSIPAAIVVALQGLVILSVVVADTFLNRPSDQTWGISRRIRSALGGLKKIWVTR